MKTTELTCIVCPMGCTLQVEQDEDGTVRSVHGNSCPRGAAYGKDEVSHPTRTLTSTVRTADGRLVSVKTDRPIPKDKLFAAMERVNRVVAQVPIAIGDVLLEDLFGARLVATVGLKD